MDLDKLNSATKYPSIQTYHQMGQRGRINSKVQVGFPPGEKLYLSEKVDGTNGRILLLHDGPRDYIVGSREEFLFAKGDLIWNTTYEIKTVLAPIADRMEESTKPGHVLVYFFEVYGAGLPAAKQYTAGKAMGARVFDVCSVPLEILEMPIEKIASWRDHGGQSFCREEEIDIAAGSIMVDRTPYLGAVDEIPTGLEDTYEWMKQFRTSRCHLGGGTGRSEGIVARTADRKAVAKLRFEDYEKTLGIQRGGAG